MRYIYAVMKLVGYIIIKHIIKKHKEHATTWYQNYVHKMKNNYCYEVTKLQGKNGISPPTILKLVCFFSHFFNIFFATGLLP